MAIRKIVLVGDDILRKKCRPVTSFDARLHTLIDDMEETLLQADGYGLAAPQVGMLKRVVVLRGEEGGSFIELVNPEIIKRSGKQEAVEGCLSIPGKWGVTKRPQKVTVRAQDRDGHVFEKTGEGLLARGFCHEIDHLDGILYTDHAIRMLTEEEMEKERQ